MSKSLLLLVFLFAFHQSSILITNVVLREGNSVCELSYVFPKEVSNKKVSYCKVGQANWNEIPLTQSKGQINLDDLESDKLYVSRLNWTTSTGIEKTNKENYFRTFASVHSATEDFKGYRIIMPTENKNLDIHVLYQSKISFVYKDQYNNDGKLIGEVYDQNNIVVNRFYTNKNSKDVYHVDLLSVDFNWQEDEKYTFKVFDDLNVPKWFNVQFETSKDQLVLEMNSNALYISCLPEEASIIQFNGLVNGGSMPYEVFWLIHDSESNEALYGPTESLIIRDNSIPFITIEFPLSYSVTLSVFDGCGLFKETSVMATCQPDDESENTIFFEALPNQNSDAN